MTIRFTVTPTMLYGAQRAMMRHIRWTHLSGYFVVVLYPLVLIGITLAYGGTVMGALRNNAVMIIALPIFWLFGIPLLMRWTTARTLRNTPTLQGELVYSFAEDGVDLRGQNATSHLEWSAFTRAAETKDFILLFQNKAMATFLPKSAFADLAELQGFRALVRRHLDDTVRGPEVVAAAT